MTFAPPRLVEARALLIDELGIEPAAVGIVGDGPHTRTGSSYHLGKTQLRPDSYSIVESSRDGRGLTDAAAALDIGEFTKRVGVKTHNLRTFSAWLVAQCKAGAPDTADIREVIYSLDGETVHRWDRLGRRSTGDSSHTFHTHISYFRDSESRDKTALFRRYITEVLEDDMALADDLIAITNSTAAEIGGGRREGDKVSAATLLQLAVIYAARADDKAAAANDQVTALGKSLTAAITALSARDYVDEQALAAELAPGVAAAVVAALPEDRDDITPEELQQAIVGALRELVTPAS
jgi:hypothetical protein